MTVSGVKFYHRTTREAADTILAHGFRDAEGNYLTANIYRGVWISEMPLDVHEGAKGDVLLIVEVAVDVTDMDQWEWVEEGKLYREWLVSAAWLNERGSVRELTGDEAEAAVAAGWETRRFRAFGDEEGSA